MYKQGPKDDIQNTVQDTYKPTMIEKVGKQIKNTYKNLATSAVMLAATVGAGAAVVPATEANAMPTYTVSQSVELDNDYFSNNFTILNTSEGGSSLDALKVFRIEFGSNNYGLTEDNFIYQINTSGGNRPFDVNIFDTYSTIDTLVDPGDFLNFQIEMETRIQLISATEVRKTW